MHIVHIDGDTLLREVLKRAVRLSNQRPIRLEQFANGDDAMPYIERNLHDVDLFFISVDLPGTVNGLQIARLVRSRGYCGPIVVTSAHDVPDPSWLDAQQVEFLPHPWHIRDFILKLPAYNRWLEPGV